MNGAPTPLMAPPTFAIAITAIVAIVWTLVPAPAIRRPAPPGGNLVARPPARMVGARCNGLLGRRLDRMRALVGRRTRQRRIDTALPDAIELLVLAVHAGASPGQAVLDVRPAVDPVLTPAFDAVAHRLQRGHGLADAIAALTTHLGHRAAGVVDAIAGADRYGGPLAPVLDGLAREARDERRRAAEAEARTLSVKLSFPLVACTLPAFVLLAIAPVVIGALLGLPASP